MVNCPKIFMLGNKES